MCVRLLCNCVFATACSLALPLTSPSVAMDEPNRKEAVVEFVEIPGQPPLKYDMQCVVELVGTTQVIGEIKSTVGAGMSAKGMAAAGEAMLEDYGVKCKVDGVKVVVSGWKNPKTGKVYLVKQVKFTSKTMPKELMPKVTNPKLRIG